jgi:hypothetical protein
VQCGLHGSEERRGIDVVARDDVPAGAATGFEDSDDAGRHVADVDAVHAARRPQREQPPGDPAQPLRVLAEVVVAWPVHAAGVEADHRCAGVLECAGDPLGGHLGCQVGPVGHVAQRQSCRVTATAQQGRGGRDVHDRIAPCCDTGAQHDLGGPLVDALDVPSVRTVEGEDGGGVHHRLAARDGREHRTGIRRVADGDPDPVEQICAVLAQRRGDPAGVPHEEPDVVPGVDQCGHRGRSDEPRAARDENLHGAASPCPPRAAAAWRDDAARGMPRRPADGRTRGRSPVAAE